MTGADHAQAYSILDKKDWETPEWIVRGVERLYGIKFTLDAAASESNKKAPRFIDESQNALTESLKLLSLSSDPAALNHVDFLAPALSKGLSILVSSFLTNRPPISGISGMGLSCPATGAGPASESAKRGAGVGRRRGAGARCFNGRNRA